MKPWPKSFTGLTNPFPNRSQRSWQRIGAFYNWRKKYYTTPVSGFSYKLSPTWKDDLKADVKAFIDNGFKFRGYDEPMFY